MPVGRLQLAELFVHQATHLASIPSQILLEHQVDRSQCRGAADRIAGVRRSHAAGGMHVHHIGPTGNGG